MFQLYAIDRGDEGFVSAAKEAGKEEEKQEQRQHERAPR